MNTNRLRHLTLGLLAAGGLLLTACGNDNSTADGKAPALTAPAPTTAPSTTSAPSSSVEIAMEPVDSLPASELDRIAGELEALGAPASEAACVRAADGLDGAADCLSIDTLVLSQEDYLRNNTDATEAQVACVSAALRDAGVERARELALDGIGAAIYVPCGLPD